MASDSSPSDSSSSGASSETTGRRFDIYTDGGARPNPGPGGWGAVFVDPDSDLVLHEFSGGAEETTNNRMELTAAIEALAALEPGGAVGEAADGEAAAVRVVTDSTYLKQGVTRWLPGWIARGWKRKGGKLENEDLWRRLAARIEEREVEWSWIKGHAGHDHNERADRLASREIGLRTEVAHARTSADCDATAWLKVSGGTGWAALVETGSEGEGEVLSQRAGRSASANQLDLEAAIAVLEAVPEGGSIAVRTGSDYLRNGATQWIHGWRRGGWKTKSGKPVAHRRLWETLDALQEEREVEWLPVDDPKGEPLKRLGRVLSGL